ncbi:MAG TPA: glycoside hydrolase family 3 N-terminal domain-containing protein [Candidatus Limnocylindrales bacterium]
MIRGRAHLAALTVLAVIAGACGSEAPTQAVSSTAPTPVAVASPGPSDPTDAGGTTAADGSCVARTLDAMTEAQRIGQLFMIQLPKDQLDAKHRAAIEDDHFGSVWFGRSTAGVEALRAVSNSVQRLATPAATNGVRFLIAANQEGGLIQGLSGPGFATIPSAVDQGRMTPAALTAAAVTWAHELRRAGVNVNFAPTADVVPPGGDATNAPIGQLDREYGHHPRVVASHVAAFIGGMRAGGIATTAKHFPGLGRVEGNTDHTADVVDTVTTPDDAYLRPFRRAIDDAVPFVMVSLATYERIDASAIAAFSPTIVTGLLRTTLGFRGVIMSDSLTAEAVAAIPPADRAIRFIASGGDLIVLGRLATAISMAKGLASLAATSPAFATTIDAAARRVLRAKAAAGLVDCGS